MSNTNITAAEHDNSGSSFYSKLRLKGMTNLTMLNIYYLSNVLLIIAALVSVSFAITLHWGWFVMPAFGVDALSLGGAFLIHIFYVVFFRGAEASRIRARLDSLELKTIASAEVLKLPDSEFVEFIRLSLNRTIGLLWHLLRVFIFTAITWLVM